MNRTPEVWPLWGLLDRPEDYPELARRIALYLHRNGRLVRRSGLHADVRPNAGTRLLIDNAGLLLRHGIEPPSFTFFGLARWGTLIGAALVTPPPPGATMAAYPVAALAAVAVHRARPPGGVAEVRAEIERARERETPEMRRIIAEIGRDLHGLAIRTGELP